MTPKTTASEQLLCSCGHVHARGEPCKAIMSGTPMLNYCKCTGCTPNGEHLAVPPVETPQ